MEPLMPRDPGNIGAVFAVERGRFAFPSPFPPTEDQQGWLSPAGLATAVDDSIPVAANTMQHMVGKGGHTTRLIEDISGVIVGVGDRGNGEVTNALFGPKRHVDVA